MLLGDKTLTELGFTVEEEKLLLSIHRSILSTMPQAGWFPHPQNLHAANNLVYVVLSLVAVGMHLYQTSPVVGRAWLAMTEEAGIMTEDAAAISGFLARNTRTDPHPDADRLLNEVWPQKETNDNQPTD